MHHLTFIPALAQTGTGFAVQLASAALFGAGVFVLVRTVVGAMTSADVEQDEAWRYDVNRINELRRVSPFYRLFQPVVVPLARLNRRLFAGSLPEIGRQIQAAGMSRFWTAGEYLGSLQLTALILLPVYLVFAMRAMGPPGAIVAVGLSGLTLLLLRRRLAGRARYRLFKIKQRMPFLLDLLTLLMEAGSTFTGALEEAVREFRDHPVGEEFGRVLAEISMGKSRTNALEGMRDRLDDPEITSIVGTIVQGEMLGTPLAKLFRSQADLLRIKRTQRAETIAGEAGVQMLAPAVLVMAATVIVILGPFLLGFIYSDFMM